MSLDKDFLDLGKPKHSSTFGIISIAMIALWMAFIILPGILGIRSMDWSLNRNIVWLIQLLGLIAAIISIRKNETRRILYLVGLIINGVAFIYLGLSLIM